MNAQNCPKCGKEPAWGKISSDDISYGCSGDCIFSFGLWEGFSVSLKEWNEIRIAPNDKYLKTFIMNRPQTKVFYPDKIKMSAHMGTLLMPWMNPKFENGNPEEQEKIFCRMCKGELVWNGKYYEHLRTKPRHPATPEGED